MFFSTTAQYALRAMAHIASQPPGTSVRAQDLAANVDVPLPYLSKILRRMVVAGLLKSQKGHGGGFVLAKRRDRISYEKILAAADFSPDEKGCAFGWGQCDPEDGCPLHPSWSRMKTSYQRWTKSSSLDDVTPMRKVSPRRLAKQLARAKTPKRGRRSRTSRKKA